jgi:uncharacterized protein (DUF2062 family)
MQAFAGNACLLQLQAIKHDVPLHAHKALTKHSSPWLRKCFSTDSELFCRQQLTLLAAHRALTAAMSAVAFAAMTASCEEP